jgi:hypothetical protein
MAKQTIFHFYDDPPVPDPNPGFVYLVAKGTAYKIGCAVDVQARLKRLKRKYGDDLQLIHVIPSDHHTLMESRLHVKYNKKRLAAEWFALTPADVEQIKMTGGESW